jgi:cob(I)alamin adenosyltransferase
MMKTDMELHQRMWRGWAGQETLPDEKTKGLLVVFTGSGKGKSTAAFGMGSRALAQQMKLGVIQFFGGANNSAEYQSLAKHPLCDFKIFCSHCSWQVRDRNVDIAAVAIAWEVAKKMLQDPSYQMVILLKHQYLSLDSLIQVLRQRPAHLHVVITGRYAPVELIDAADLVTEMRAVKHPLNHSRIAPQAGVEY